MGKLKWLVPVVVLALAGAACSSDDGGDSSSSTAPSGTSGASSSDLCAAADAGPIKIVHLTDIVGESATAIDDFWNGSQLAAKQINDECGSEVVTLERIPTDFSVAGFESSYLQALEMEPTAVIAQGSSSQIAQNNLVTEGQVPTLWPVGTATGMLNEENGSEYAWMTRVVNDTQGQVWGQHLVEEGAKNVWLECVQTQLGVSGCGGATPILDENDVAVAGRADSAFDASDFTSSIVDLKAAGADWVLLAQFPRPTIAFAQQMQDNDALGQAKMFGSTSTEVVYKAMSPEQQDNIIALADCNPREDDPTANQAYSDAYSTDMSSLAAVAYDSVYLVVDSVSRAGSNSPAEVNKALADVNYDGVCQTYFNGGTHALAHRMVVTSFAGGVIKTEATYDLNEAGDGLAG
jgi:ABC-type branched-subunit amino acid transport system substrate-binding protein